MIILDLRMFPEVGEAKMTLIKSRFQRGLMIKGAANRNVIAKFDFN